MTEDRNQNLNKKQLEAVNHGDGPILIAAGAGSGKTKTLTSRLLRLVQNGAPPESIIAITFTNKAAKEMADRMAGYKLPPYQHPFIGTFHSLGVRILKQESKFLKRTPAFTIFDDDDSLSLIRKIMKAADVDKEQYSPVKMRGKISSVKNELLDPKEHLDKIALRTFEDYEISLTKNNAFDFDDLIEKVVTLFEANLEILKKYQQKFRYILVDEYQDVNTSQYQLIRLLAAEHQNLSVVGDDAQSIYRFRGSDFRNFLNFESDWPKAKIVKLEQNYRSSNNIITAASALIQNNKMQKPKELWTENPEGSLIKVIRTADGDQEADYVAEQIGNIYDNSNKDSINQAIAILYRTNAQSRSIEQALISADIPYKIFGGLKFYERKEIKDIVAALRLASNPKDNLSAERLSKTFTKAIAADLLKELPRLGQELNILELINFFLHNTDYFEYLAKHFKNPQERIENINELIAFAAEFKNLPEFLERVSLLQSADQPKGSPTGAYRNLPPVNLMTIHLAKGLEFDRVFVIGCNEGLLPHQMSYGAMEEIEEERRLMYVAMTRAKEDLSLSFFSTPSRFVYELPPELTDFVNLTGNKQNLPDEDDMYIDDF
ncbi:MAG: UvrD-helicase domain-containing protein [bacterium]|nr:UvrD-helicase domain-containing protein [bacterium]